MVFQCFIPVRAGGQTYLHPYKCRRPLNSISRTSPCGSYSSKTYDNRRGKRCPQSPFYVFCCSIMVLTLYGTTLFYHSQAISRSSSRKLLPIVSLGDHELPNPLGRGWDISWPCRSNQKTKGENPGIEGAVLETDCLMNY